MYAKYVRVELLPRILILFVFFKMTGTFSKNICPEYFPQKSLVGFVEKYTSFDGNQEICISKKIKKY